MIDDKFKKIEIEPAELSALVVSYLESSEMAKSTVRSRKFALRLFLEFHKTRKIFYFWPDHIDKYRYHLEYKLKLSSVTIRNYLAGLNKFFYYLCEQNILEKNPAKRIKFKIKKDNKDLLNDDLINNKNQFVSLSKIERIIHTPSLGITETRNKLLFLISIYSGIKVNYLCGLKQNKLVKIERTFYIFDGKINQPIDIKINFLINDYLILIKKYDSEYLFFNTAKNAFGRKLSSEFIRNIFREYFNTIGTSGSPSKLIRNTSVMVYINKYKSRKKLIERFDIKTRSVADKYMNMYNYFAKSV